MPVRSEQLVVDALSDWLRAQLPAQVAAVNATRAAVIKTPTAGPFTIPIGAVLKLSLTGRGDAPVSVPLTPGAARTPTQLAADVNVALSGVGSVDAVLGNLALTSTTAPSAGVDSVLSVEPDTTGAATALGFEAGGEYCMRSALVAPGVKGVSDGVPAVPDLGRGFWVVIMDRHTLPVAPEARRDESEVALELAIFYRITGNEAHRNRELITAALQCVRQALVSTSGRQLGRAAQGDIIFVRMGEAMISAVALKVRLNESAPNALMDVAAQKIAVKVFERPDYS